MAEASLKVVKHSSKRVAALYATCADFCRIFAEDMKDLYLVALVLTVDSEKAEQCFVSGLDDCTSGNQVFKEWARSWARRVVIKRAIRLIGPQPGGATRNATQIPNSDRALRVPAEVSAVVDLPAFERFAFVMSVLERYSDLDCALLLGCTRESLIQARLRAFERISDIEGHKGLREDKGLKQKSLPDNADSQELDLRFRLATPA